MMGCGVVGGGVYRRIKSLSDRFEIVKILIRNPSKYIDQGYKPSELTTEIQEILDSNPDVFIDVSGPIEPALEYCKLMIENKVHVISANKQAIAKGGVPLINFANDEEHTAFIFFCCRRRNACT